MKGERKKNRYVKAGLIVALMMLVSSSATATMFIDTQSVSINKWSVSDHLEELDYHEYYPDPPLEISLAYTFSTPTITPIDVGGTVYHRITLDDLPRSSEINKPLVPMQPVDVLLPQTGEVQSVQVTYGSKISLGTGYNVEVGTEPVTVSSSTSSYIYDPDEELTYSHADQLSVKPWVDPTPPTIFPGVLYTPGNTFSFRGYGIYTLSLNPVHVKPSTGEIYYYDEMTVTIFYTETGTVDPLFRGLAKDELLMQTMVDDYTMVGTYQTYAGMCGSSGIIDPSDSYDYVIITNEALKNAQGTYTFQTLRDFKNDRGTETTIVTVEDIYDEYTGVDQQEKIRNFIKDAYMDWETDYILIGGDVAVVPVRVLCTAFYGVDIELIPSDLYYACLHGSFNLDGDEYWGELGDLPDLRAEVYIGRACVQTEQELSNFVEKTLTYITTPTSDEYIEDVLMAGEQLDSLTFGGDSLDELIDTSYDGGFYTRGIPSDEYTIIKLYDRDWPGHDWPKSEIIEYINNNIHYINHDGHSNYHINMKMADADADALTNTKHCFVYSNGCMAGGFDEEDCIAEHLTVKTSHGAFAGIWNTRYGWYLQNHTFGPSQNFQRQFWDAIYRESETSPVKKELGAANQDSKEDNIWRLFVFPNFVGMINRFCYYEITLFGDPQIVIKTPSEPAPHWVSPTGFQDPDNAWDYEPFAYDTDVDTKAGCQITTFGWLWTPYLELTISPPLPSTKIRFYAWYNLFHCDSIDVDIYYSGSWHNLYQGSFTGYQWVTKTFSEHDVSKARVRFHVQRWFLSPVIADLHEFQFYEAT